MLKEELKELTPRDWEEILKDVLIFGLPGQDGKDGTNGQDGIQGPMGLTGDRGPIGIRGDVGPQGIQGLKGDKGEKGNEGNVGTQGVQGQAGEPGRDGRDGINGRDAIGQIDFSQDGITRQSVQPKDTRYIRFVINEHITTIDIYKFTN